MNELTATSIISLFQTNREERKSFVEDVINRLYEGQADPLKIHLQIKCMEDVIKQITSNEKYKSIVLEEAGRQA